MKDYDGLIDGVVRAIRLAEFEHKQLRRKMIENRQWLATCKNELKRLKQEKEAHE